MFLTRLSNSFKPWHSGLQTHNIPDTSVGKMTVEFNVYVVYKDILFCLH